MTNFFSILAAIFGLGILMVVHETGHYLAARAFGMRVTKFSLGMAPVLWRFKPKNSPTTFQIGALPFFAYVQIAGMNPLEDVPDNDKGSYANASLFGRIVTIVAGSLANYLIASVFFFGSILLNGKPTTVVRPLPDQPAAQAGMRDGDKVVEVDGVAVETWEQFRTLIVQRPNKATPVVVEREGARQTLTVTPAALGENGGGQVGVRFIPAPVPFPEAAKAAVLMPPRVVTDLVRGLGRWVTGKQKAELGGPAAIVKEGAKAARLGTGELLFFLGFLSANLAGFNLLPIPALDGGRLLFLGYEAVTRRRPDAMVEAHVHLVGFFMLLALMVVVTYGDLFGKR
ncbi:MAG TPA: M50 family metallopeptidase [Polyangiaceae bacterium]|nr:M50 family metallopeptidase [Polyangiaceae bacterium]